MFAKTALVVFAIMAVAAAAPKPGYAPLAYTAAAPVAYTAGFAAPVAYHAPIAPVASSSQVIARNYNGVASYVTAPAAAYVAHHAAPYVAAPATYVF